jgi:rare lipoprotein A (peptidoglycan hydrolase)
MMHGHDHYCRSSKQVREKLKWAILAVALALLPFLTTDQPVRAQRAQPVYVQHGLASWYGPGFQGKKTASGERFISTT